MADTARPLRHRLAVGAGAAGLVVADVFTLGFVTLGFEMVASRILTPLFGSGIYTWATIISIVVGGLMAGYFLGGIVADRFPGFGLAATIKFIASVYLFFIYFMSRGGLEGVIAGVGNEYAALFLSGFVVCFPPLLVLGMYSPLSVRLLLKLPSDAGKISGGLFAISSLGNILGIIITTFFLIPSVGTRAITAGFATFLLASGFLSLVTRVLYSDAGDRQR
ncbi:MAG: fused MFS/spermidine synthase [Bauldia sp.]|nr:fused MFS/spermidine synthase [Bauldia sp.]